MAERVTMGAYLRAARRRRRISLERAAEETRIRADFIMRMESDEFDFLAPTYVRGFLKSYARYLRADPTPLLDDFDRRYGTGRSEASQLVAFERQTRQNRAARGPRLNNWGVAAILASIVIVGLAVVGLIQGDETQPTAERADVAEAPLDDDADGLGPASPSPTPTPEPSATPDDGAIAFTDGIEVEIVASQADCWVLASEDGVEVNPAGETIPVGESLILTAQEQIFVRLGYP
ncbi:MAG: helix-turn-helix domain-containing protein, partial [Actinomycetota bacterium]